MKFIFLVILALSLFTVSPEKTIKNKQVRIAIVDTGLDLNNPRFSKHLCTTGHKNFVMEESMKDTHGHGTCVTDIIQNYAKNVNYCLLIYKYFNSTGSTENITSLREVDAMKEAIKNKADIINFSSVGQNYNVEEDDIIRKNPKTFFIVASGNTGVNLDTSIQKYYPANLSYPNLFAIGSLNKEGQRSTFSNYGKNVKNYEIGENIKCSTPNNTWTYQSGTSMATAVYSALLANRISKKGAYNVHKFGF